MATLTDRAMRNLAEIRNSSLTSGQPRGGSTGNVISFERFVLANGQQQGDRVPQDPNYLGGWTDTLSDTLENVSPIYKAIKTVADAKAKKEAADKAADKATEDKKAADAARAKSEEHGGQATAEQRAALALARGKGKVDVPWWVWALAIYVFAKKL
jgi:hypothetical protein